MSGTAALSPALPAATPQDAARAYRAADGSFGAPAASGSDFGGALARALEGAVQSGVTAEAQATQALSGSADLTDVVQAVSRAELALQTATAIRDRVVQAYQDIMKMPI